MIPSPLSYQESLRIGCIDFVSPDEIKVLLDIDAPDSIALNAGQPRTFPRINGYVLIPCDLGFVVGQVEWITIERSQYPKRQGMKDFGLVDLPYPLRKMSLNPIGTLSCVARSVNEVDRYDFRRGVETYPSVGDNVILPTEIQLKSIVESGKHRRVKIGSSLLAASAEVAVDPDRLFGRHLAVLGNTGSGKSCSVAGLIRWSLEAAQKHTSQQNPNARFIILDPNGEYTRAFHKDSFARFFSVEPDDQHQQLEVPLWFWNSAEWCAFTQASPKVQKPLIRRALREIKNGPRNDDGDEIERELELRRQLSSSYVLIRNDRYSNAIKTESKGFGTRLRTIRDEIDQLAEIYPKYDASLRDLSSVICTILEGREANFQDRKTGKSIENYNPFEDAEIADLLSELDKVLQILGGLIHYEGPQEDIPIEFQGVQFADHIEQISKQEKNGQYTDTLVTRIRSLISDIRMRKVSGETSIDLETWLKDYIGNNQASNGTVTVLDLSLVPAEIVHIIATVVARLTFETLQRYRKMHQASKTLPTVLVMEEAHNFIKRYKDEGDGFDSAMACCQVFERIAREGRKFGLGLVLSSQRPSELSPTVLSQCNSFLLHRLSNDRDQEIVHKLVPDNLRGLLRDLPTLPSQNAILMGWASELPLLVRMNDLPAEQRPQSDDPDFWDVWTGESQRTIDWQGLCADWQQGEAKCTQPHHNGQNKETHDSCD